jgi:predicted acetyltransferase
MAEFLVMPRYRRAGVGRFAAQRLFASLPGPWRVREVAGNEVAVAFWRAVIPFSFTEDQDEYGTTQLFTMPAG